MSRFKWISESDLFVRRDIAAYMNVPVYRAFQEWVGRSQLLSPMWDAWQQGDRRGALATIPDQVVQELTLRGTMPEIRDHVQCYMDTACLYLLTMVQLPERKRDVVMRAIRELAPG